jgi:hypothetical protein
MRPDASVRTSLMTAMTSAKDGSESDVGIDGMVAGALPLPPSTTGLAGPAAARRARKAS